MSDEADLEWPLCFAHWDDAKVELRLCMSCTSRAACSAESPGSETNGIDPHAPGAKLDAGKPRAALVLGHFPRALQAVVDVGTYGAAKYTPNGWRAVPDGEDRYLDACMRHLLAMFAGEATDPESGITHLAHATWNLLAVAELRAQR